MSMCYRVLILAVFVLGVAGVRADTAASVSAETQAAIDAGTPPRWWAPTLPSEIEEQVKDKAAGLIEKLALAQDKVPTLNRLIVEHYARVWAWHQQVDEKLDTAWEAWDDARGNNGGLGKDELKALAIMTERIDPIYAEFTPQIRRFLVQLKDVIGETKAIALLDHITWSPGAKRTYNAYLEMVPQMKEDEKAILWKRLAQAREDSLACWSSKRIVKIFKKHKVRNEFSIDYFGYGYRKHYKAWAESKK